MHVISLLPQRSLQQVRAAIKDLMSVAYAAIPRHSEYQKWAVRLRVRKQTAVIKARDCERLQNANLFRRMKRQRRLTGLTSRRGPGRWHVRVQAPASVTPAAVRSARVYVHRGGRRAAVSPAPRGPRGLEAACWADRRHW